MASNGGNGLGSKPAGLVKFLFMVHLILSAWSMQGTSIYSVPNSYLYYNIVFMAAIIWALASTNGLEAVSSAIFVNVAVIILDIITITLYWPKVVGASRRIFFILAIINTVLRPVTVLFLYGMFKEQDTEGVGLLGALKNMVGLGGASNGGNSGGSNGNNGGANPKGYQSIDGSNSGGSSSSSNPNPSTSSSAAAAPSSSSSAQYQEV